MTTNENYYTQYENAKRIAMDAIKNKQHVILVGGDATGKTHLTRELEQEGHWSYDNYYNIFEGDDRLSSYDPNTHRLWIQCSDIMSEIAKVRDDSFAVINMSKYQYPGIAAR